MSSEIEQEVTSRRNGRTRPLVLIVDTDEAVRLANGSLLALQGFDTVAVTNGKQAVVKARQVWPDAILLDLKLPDLDLDGVDVIREILTTDPPVDVPILILTDVRSTRLHAAALDAGAASYMIKGETTLREVGHAIQRAISPA